MIWFRVHTQEHTHKSNSEQCLAGKKYHMTTQTTQNYTTVLPHVIINPPIHFLPLIPLRVAGGLEPISASSGEGRDTLDKSPVHRRADI